MHQVDKYDWVKMDGEVGEVIGLFCADNYLIRFADGREVNSYKKLVELVRRENKWVGFLRCLTGKHRMHYGFGSPVRGSCARCGYFYIDAS